MILCAIGETSWSPNGKTSIPVSLYSFVISLSFHPNFSPLSLAENYTKLCTINTKPGKIPMKRMVKPNGQGKYYRVDYEHVLIFGLTELKAQVAWKQGVSGHSFFYQRRICALNNSLTYLFVGLREKV